MPPIRRRPGFTAPEIIMAIAIIAIILAVLVPSLTRGIRVAEINSLAQNLDGFRTAIQRFKGNVTKYPGSLFDLQLRPVGSLDACGVGISLTNWNKWAGPYVSLSAVGSPDTTGVAAAEWVVSDTLVRTPATAATGTSPGRLDMQIADMKLEDANSLNDIVDGVTGNIPPQSAGTDTAGIVRWGTVTNGVTTVKYGLAIAGC